MRLRRNFFGVLSILILLTGCIWSGAMALSLWIMIEDTNDYGAYLGEYLGYSWVVIGVAFLACLALWQRNDIGYSRQRQHEEQLAEMRRLRAAMENTPPNLKEMIVPPPPPERRYEDSVRVLIDPGKTKYTPEIMVEPTKESTKPDSRYAPKKIKKLR